MNAKQDSLLIPHNGPMPIIIPDAAHVIVGEVTEKKPEAEWIRQFAVAGDFLSKTKAWEEIPATTFTQPLYDAAMGILRGNRALLKVAVLQGLPERGGAWKSAELRELLRWLVGNVKEEIPVRTAALQVCGKWDSGKGNSAFYASLLGDSSYYVAGTALGLLSKTDSAEALRAARKILDEKTARSLLLSNAAEIVAQTGKEEDLLRISANAEGKWGSARLPLVEPVVLFWKADGTNGRAALALLQKWLFEEEAGFMKERHLGEWQDMVVRAQEERENPFWRAKREALRAFLKEVQAAEKDAATAERIGKMAERVK